MKLGTPYDVLMRALFARSKIVITADTKKYPFADRRSMCQMGNKLQQSPPSFSGKITLFLPATIHSPFCDLFCLYQGHCIAC